MSYKLWKKNYYKTDPCKSSEKKPVESPDPWKDFEKKNTNATENSVLIKALNKEIQKYQKTLKTSDPIKPST